MLLEWLLTAVFNDGGIEVLCQFGDWLHVLLEVLLKQVQIQGESDVG